MPVFDESHSRQDGCHLWTQEQASSPVLPSLASGNSPIGTNERPGRMLLLTYILVLCLIFLNSLLFLVQHCYFSHWLLINTTGKSENILQIIHSHFCSWFPAELGLLDSNGQGGGLGWKNTIVPMLWKWQSDSREGTVLVTPRKCPAKGWSAQGVSSHP